MKKLVPLTASPRYERFIKQRDQSLERILAKYLTSFDRIVDGLKKRCHEVAAYISTHEQSRELIKRNRQAFEHRIAPWFDIGASRSEQLLIQLRKTTFTLSYIGQAEAIGRTLGKRTAYKLDKRKLDIQVSKEMRFGGSVHARTELAFHRLLRDVLDAFQVSQVMASPLQETLGRIDAAFPKQKKMKRIQKLMAPMREAANWDDLTEEEREKLEEGFSFGEIDPKEWEKIVDDYISDQIPFGRAPEDKIFLGGKTPEGEDEFVYSWQVEQEATDDFISQVRDGEILSANENGINDFQWIAIIDSKTDNCCSVRDGLSTSEIQEKLDNGDLDDDCDAISPPAHFSCRCRVAPLTEDLPEETTPDEGSWDSWLQSKAEAA